MTRNSLVSTVSLLILGGLLAVGSDVQAQSYWDDYNQTLEEDGADYPSWNLEFRIGPYTPNIDGEFDATGSSEGPFETTFGTDSSLYLGIGVDRFIFTNHIAQWGVSFSAGHISKTAKSFNSTDGSTDTASRSADDTTFRMIPLSASALVRLTALDNLWGIPFVPYAKVGLSYYVWRFSNATGVSESEGKKGNGATLGTQASLGMSIRAEKLDASSARALKNEMGIYHAGFFAEYLIANVDGFGSDSKLHVGDKTVVAGINFEF